MSSTFILLSYINDTFSVIYILDRNWNKILHVIQSNDSFNNIVLKANTYSLLMIIYVRKFFYEYKYDKMFPCKISLNHCFISIQTITNYYQIITNFARLRNRQFYTHEPNTYFNPNKLANYKFSLRTDELFLDRENRDLHQVASRCRCFNIISARFYLCGKSACMYRAGPRCRKRCTS